MLLIEAFWLTPRFVFRGLRMMTVSAPWTVVNTRSWPVEISAFEMANPLLPWLG